MTRNVKPAGWRREPGRHSLAARGIKSGTKKRKKVVVVPQKKHKWGFDLTDITASRWQTLIDEHDLVLCEIHPYPDRPEIKHFHWKGEGILIVTKNNPITGEYGEPGVREREVGYASYIGIEGKRSKVLAVKNYIKRSGSIKDESPHERSYI